METHFFYFSEFCSATHFNWANKIADTQYYSKGYELLLSTVCGGKGEWEYMTSEKQSSYPFISPLPPYKRNLVIHCPKCNRLSAI